MDEVDQSAPPVAAPSTATGRAARPVVVAISAALLVALVGSLWWAASARDSTPNDRLSPADAPATSVQPTPAQPPTPPSTIVPVPRTTGAAPPLDEMATASPDRARPGERVTLAVPSPVERNCSDVVVVYDFDNAIIGQVTGGERWEPASSPAVPTSQPACQTTVTADSLTIVVPPLPDGGYRFCISVVNDFRGCPTVFVFATA